MRVKGVLSNEKVVSNCLAKTISKGDAPMNLLTADCVTEKAISMGIGLNILLLLIFVTWPK